MRFVFFPRTTAEANAVVTWVANRLGEPISIFHDPYGYCLMDENSEVLLGVVLHDYSGHNMMMSLAIQPGVILSPALVAELMRVPFESPLDASRVTAFVDETNLRSLRLIEAIGFSEEGRIRKHFGDHDAFVYGLLKDEFLEGRYGRRIRKQAGESANAVGGNDFREEGVQLTN